MSSIFPRMLLSFIGRDPKEMSKVSLGNQKIDRKAKIAAPQPLKFLALFLEPEHSF